MGWFDNALVDLEDRHKANWAKATENDKQRYNLIWGNEGKIKSQIRANQAWEKYYNMKAEYYRLKINKEFGKNFDNRPDIKITSGKVL